MQVRGIEKFARILAVVAVSSGIILAGLVKFGVVKMPPKVAAAPAPEQAASQSTPRPSRLAQKAAETGGDDSSGGGGIFQAGHLQK